MIRNMTIVASRLLTGILLHLNPQALLGADSE